MLTQLGSIKSQQEEQTSLLDAQNTYEVVAIVLE